MNLIRSLGHKNSLPPGSLAFARYSIAAKEVKGPASDDEHQEARNWLSGFSIKSIPRNACEVTYSRSSGPGGQNVNK